MAKALLRVAKDSLYSIQSGIDSTRGRGQEPKYPQKEKMTDGIRKLINNTPRLRDILFQAILLRAGSAGEKDMLRHRYVTQLQMLPNAH